MCEDSLYGENHLTLAPVLENNEGEKEVNIVLHVSEINRAWHRRLIRVAIQYSQLQACMAWYSTLGGAHSSLGDRIGIHAHYAGEVSKKQLVLATRLGDSGLIARCHLYLAFSLLQQGKLEQAKYIILKQMEFANSPQGRTDDKLMVMCQSAWTRLQYQKGQPLLKYNDDNNLNVGSSDRR